MNTLIEGDRLTAFLMVNGKVYISDCDHQECLEMYYKDAGIKSEFDYSQTGENYDNVHNAAIQKTYALKQAHEVCGFDLFDIGDYILLAHDKITYDACLDWMKQYQHENSECGIILGYFTNGMNAILTDDVYAEAV